MSEPITQEIESFEEIAATIQQYADGARAADGGRMRWAFYRNSADMRQLQG
jgi:hypothetical protein